MKLCVQFTFSKQNIVEEVHRPTYTFLPIPNCYHQPITQWRLIAM